MRLRGPLSAGERPDGLPGGLSWNSHCWARSAVATGSGELALGPAKRRSVLALLLLQPNTTVPLEQLIDSLWEDEPPEHARTVVQGHVSRLRATLAEGGADAYGIELTTHGSAYLLRLPEELIDAHRFGELVALARPEAAPADAVPLLREALGLWRGPALTGTVTSPALRGRRPRAGGAQADRRRGAGARPRRTRRTRTGRRHPLLRRGRPPAARRSDRRADAGAVPHRAAVRRAGVVPPHPPAAQRGTGRRPRRAAERRVRGDSAGGGGGRAQDRRRFRRARPGARPARTREPPRAGCRHRAAPVPAGTHDAEAATAAGGTRQTSGRTGRRRGCCPGRPPASWAGTTNSPSLTDALTRPYDG